MSTLEILAGPPKQERPPEQSPEIEVIPYNALADSMADRMLPWMWQKLQEDDLVDLYFPGQSKTGFATMVRVFSGDAQVAMFKITNPVEDTVEETLPGFITWTPIPMGACPIISAGFIFFRKWWGHGLPDKAAKAAFAFWFDKMKVEIVLGFCPSLHRLAIAYNERIGLREVGRIPKAHTYKGKVCDAIEYAITREQWEAKCQQQHYQQ